MAMTFSSRARYGVRAMFQFASHWGGGGRHPTNPCVGEGSLLGYLEQLVLLSLRRVPIQTRGSMSVLGESFAFHASCGTRSAERLE